VEFPHITIFKVQIIDNKIREDFRFSKPPIIDNNVWIGMSSRILPGIKIGDNSIGSRSVVTKDIPASEIRIGNPAGFIKKLDLKGQ
jgi:acetyltransferase-like isoleucine patch superfamily enzyme